MKITFSVFKNKKNIEKNKIEKIKRKIIDNNNKEKVMEKLKKVGDIKNKINESKNKKISNLLKSDKSNVLEKNSENLFYLYHKKYVKNTKKRQLNLQNYSKNTYIIFPIYIFLLVLLFNFFGPNIIKLTSNIGKDYNKNLSNLIGIYPLANISNYILNEKNIEDKKMQIAKDNIKDSSEETMFANKDEKEKIKIIDDVCNMDETKAVFFNNNKFEYSSTIIEETKSLQKVRIGDSLILNYSSRRNIDFKSLLKKDITLTKKSDKILLFNTHTSESFVNSDGYKFEYNGGVMHTQDAKYNMIAIAKSLNENLLYRGFYSIQNTTPHDYGTYTSAYAKSRETVSDALRQMQGAGIAIDVHRDAMDDLNFAPKTNIKGVEVASLMFVIGTGTDQIKNPNFEDNLALALKIQLLADKIYPGLFRQIMLRNSVYNQDLNKYSMLVEFGATGNTIEEVKLSSRCFANLLNIIYKD